MRKWKFVGLGLLICAPLMLQLPGDTGFWRSVNNSAHTALFAFLAIAFAYLWGFKAEFRLRCVLGWLALDAGLLFGGILIELIQPLFGRQRSLEDLYLDVLGIAAGTAFYWAWRQPKGRIVFVLAGLCFFAVAAEKPARTLKWQWNLQRQLPLVCNFDSYCPGVGSSRGGRYDAIDGAQERVWPGNETRFGVLYNAASRLASVGMGVIDNDWREYSGLCMDIYLPGAEGVQISMHLRDGQFNRQGIEYKQSFQVGPGESTLCLNLDKAGEVVSLDSGRSLFLFRSRTKTAGEFYFDNVRLQ